MLVGGSLGQLEENITHETPFPGDDANCVTKSWKAPTSGAARLSVCDDASTSVSEDNTLVHFLLLARPAKHHRETSPLIHLEDKNILTQVSLG